MGPWSQAVKVWVWGGGGGIGYREQKQRSLQLSGVTELTHHLNLTRGEMSSATCIIPVFLHTACFCSFLS